MAHLTTVASPSTGCTSLLTALASSTTRGQTPLFRYSNPRTIRVLACVCHADLESRNRSGDTPLLFLAYVSRLPLVEELLLHGADANARDRGGCSVLLAATLGENQSIMRTLLEAGADISVPDMHGCTVMSAVCRDTTAEFLEMILEWGADPTVTYGGDDMPTIVGRRSNLEAAERSTMLRLLQEAATDGVPSVPPT